MTCVSTIYMRMGERDAWDSFIYIYIYIYIYMELRDFFMHSVQVNLATSRQLRMLFRQLCLFRSSSK